MNYTCIIIDDEPLAHDVLKKYVDQIGTLTLLERFYNVREAGEFLISNDVDFIFLDIQMPEMNGLDFLSSLHEKPLTIITTAHRNFALEGFELGVIDYLLKPIKYVRFKSAVDRMIEFLNLRKIESELIADQEIKTITIKTGTKTLMLPLKDIAFIQALKDYSIINISDNRKYVIKGYLKLIEKIFTQDNFIRVHKSFIVARTHLTNINKNKIDLNGYTIPVGRVFKEDVMKEFNQHG